MPLALRSRRTVRHSASATTLLFLSAFATMAVFVSSAASTFEHKSLLDNNSVQELPNEHTVGSLPVSKYIRDKAFLYVETTDNWVYANATRNLLLVKGANGRDRRDSRVLLDRHYEHVLEMIQSRMEMYCNTFCWDGPGGDRRLLSMLSVLRKQAIAVLLIQALGENRHPDSNNSLPVHDAVRTDAERYGFCALNIRSVIRTGYVTDVGSCLLAQIEK